MYTRAKTLPRPALVALLTARQIHAISSTHCLKELTTQSYGLPLHAVAMSEDTCYYSVVLNDLAGLPLPSSSTATNTITISASPTAGFYAAYLQSPPWNFTFFSYADNAPHATIRTAFYCTQNGSYYETIDIAPTFEINAVSNSLAASNTASSSSLPFEFTEGPTIRLGAQTAVTLDDSTTKGSSSMRTTPTQTQTTDSQTQSSTTAAAGNTGTPASSSTHAKAGLSTGAIVGIVIGCLIAGLIALLVALFCLKRRRRSRSSRYPFKREASSHNMDEQSFKLATGSAVSKPRHLPQPDSDQTIIGLANRTLDDIELFVENYYTDRPTAQASDHVTSDMAPFNSPYLERPLAEMITTTTAPTSIFKHCIAYYLLQKIDARRGNSSGLMPKDFVMPAGGDTQALSQQRVLIAHSQAANFDEEGNFDQAAQSIIQQFERAFRPWARGSKQDRAKNLKGILTHLSELGQRLFAQPATFEWHWAATHELRQDQIVMLPGLDKMTDSRAVKLTPPIRLISPRYGNMSAQ